MNTRAVFYTEGDARAVGGRLVGQGFTVDVARERFAGEDDDEDHAWAVTTDAPELTLNILLGEYDGWLDVEDQVDRRADANAVHGAAALGVRPPPLDLPEAPTRIKNHFRRD